MGRFFQRFWIALPILAAIVVAVSLTGAPLTLTNKLPENKTPASMIIVDRDTEYLLNSDQHILLIQAFSRTLFNGTYRRSHRFDKKTDPQVKVSVYGELGDLLWEGYICGECVVSRGYCYRRPDAVENLEYLMDEVFEVIPAAGTE